MKLSATSPEPSASHPHRVFDEKEKARLQKATKDFEALFLSYVMKGMRNGLPRDEELLGDGFGSEMMEGLIDMELSRHVAQNSNLGLAEMLYRSVTGEDLPRVVPRSPAAPVETPQPVRVPTVQPREESPMSQRETPGSQSQSANVGLPASPAIAPKATSTQATVPDTVGRRIGSLESMIQEASDKHSVDANLLKAVIAVESGGHAQARSSRNAKGLMQLIDSTAADMGVKNVWDPRQNILGGARYLQSLISRFSGDLERALASYNAGPGAVEKHDGIPPYKETRTYVDKVLSYLRYFEQQGAHDEKQD
jgi:soluble lytic murein transglycosylase-like protein